MNEKDPIITKPIVEEPNAIREGDMEAKDNKNNVPTSKKKVIFALIALLGLTSCGDKISDTRNKIQYRNDPVGLQMKQQEEIDKGEEKLKWLKHQMEVKIGQYKPLTQKYKSQKERLDKDPGNKALRKRVRNLGLEIDNRVNEIISLGEQAKKLEKKLDDKKSKTDMGVPSGDRYTNPNHLEYLEEYFDLNIPTVTANFYDYATEEITGEVTEEVTGEVTEEVTGEVTGNKDRKKKTIYIDDVGGF